MLDKTRTQIQINDEKEKLTILRKMNGDGSVSVVSINKVLCGLDNKMGKIDTSLVEIKDAINQLTGIMSNFVTNISMTNAANQDLQLTSALSPEGTTNAFVGEGGAATAVSGNEPILISMISEVKKALVDGFSNNVKAINTTSKDQQKLQAAHTKAVLANEAKRQQAEDRNRLLNINPVRKQNVGQEGNKQKIEGPKFPVNARQFMSGLGKILAGIFNPVAIIGNLIMHLLPYVVLAIAFFKGFWNRLAPELQDRAKEVAAKILIYAGLAFLLFKAPALLIQTVTLAGHAIKVGLAMLGWAKDVAFHKLRMLLLGREHTMKTSVTLYERICAGIKFAMEKALIAFQFIAEKAKLLLAFASWAIIIAGVALLLAGIILVFVMFGDKIKEAVVKIVEVFSIIGHMVYDAITGFFKMLAEIALTLPMMLGKLVVGLIKNIKLLFTGEDKKNTENTTMQAPEINTENFKDAFKEALKPITDILKAVKTCIGHIETLEQTRTGMRLFNNAETQYTANADSTQMSINNNYVSKQIADDPNETLRNNVATIANLLDKWYRDRDNTRNKRPNAITG